MQIKRWYKLDNIGKFYASIRNTKIPKVFRYSVTLYDEIDESILQEALDKTVEVYPNFNVNLKKGLFWYYLNETNKKIIVTKENLPICFKLCTNSDDFLYRVSYFNKKINFEVSHILSDGRGSIEFFKLLVSNYIKIKYKIKIELNKDNNSIISKTEDSFSKYYQKLKVKRTNKFKTYLYKGRKYIDQTRFMECYLNVNDVLNLAHKYNTTLTGLLLGVLIYSFKEEMKLSEMNKYIRIDLPVDLRNYFKSTSSMNFFGLITISYKFKSKEDTLKDIIKEINKELEEKLKKESLSERVNLMISFEKNIFCRFAPLFLKDIALNIADKIYTTKSTTCISNIGIVKFNKKIEDKIEKMSALTSTSNFQLTVCTLKDDLCIGISSSYISNEIIKNFCRYFTNNKIKMQIDVSEVI